MNENNMQSNYETFLTPKELAARLKVTLRALEVWRKQGIGPAGVKMGFKKNSAIRYRLTDVIAWEGTLPTFTAMDRSVEVEAERVA
jgi:hypothetical protein